MALPLPGLLPCTLVLPRMELSNPRQGPGLLTAPIDHTVISDHRTERPEFLGTLPLLTAPPPQNPGANPAALSSGFRQRSGQLGAVTTRGQAGLPSECPGRSACRPGPRWPSFPTPPAHRDSLPVPPRKSPRHSLPSGNKDGGTRLSLWGV